MTAKNLFEAIGMVDDALILEATEAPVRRTPVLTVLRRVLPTAACVCIVAGALLVWRNGGLLRMGSSGGNTASVADVNGANDGAMAMEDTAPEESAQRPYAIAHDETDKVGSMERTTEDPLTENDSVDLWSRELREVIWSDGEPEGAAELEQGRIAGSGGRSDVPDKYGAPSGAPMAPAWLPVYRNGVVAGYCAGLAQDVFEAIDRARELLAQGVYIEGGEAQSDIPVDLIYSPAGAEYRIPFYAFVAEADGRDVWRYVPAIDLADLQALIGGEDTIS